MRNDLSQAKVVWARLPQEVESYAKFGPSPSLMRKLAQSNRLSPLAEYVGLILKDGLLEQPVAIFQGLKRPYVEEGQDNFVYVYVTNPECNYYYAPRDRFDGTGPHENGAPVNSVFVVFVSMAPAALDDLRTTFGEAGGELRGVILGWEWTLAGVDSPGLPEFYGNRYRRKVWTRA